MSVSPSEILAALGILSALLMAAQSFFLLPYRMTQLEAKQEAWAADREALNAIRQELALLRRDFQWLASQVAKHEGIEFPPTQTPNG